MFEKIKEMDKIIWKKEAREKYPDGVLKGFRKEINKETARVRQEMEDDLKKKMKVKRDVSGKLIQIECRMRERRVISHFPDMDEEFPCVANLEDDVLKLHRKSMIRKKDRGNKEILYSEVSSIDFDKRPLWNRDSIIVQTPAEHIKLIYEPFTGVNKFFYEFYESLKEKVKETKNGKNVQEVDSLDKIKKAYELKKEGIISEEEFLSIKNKALTQ